MKKALKQKKNRKKLKLIKLMSFVILMLVATAIVVYGVSMMAKAGVDYFGENVTPSNYSLLNKIGEQVKLPKEEIKMFLKVKNPEQIQAESDFYKDVKKDDYVVIYPSLAIIYDANQNKVIKTVILKE